VTGREPTVFSMCESIRRRERSAVEAVREALDRIDRLDGGINAYRECDRDRALDRAAGIDRRLAAGDDPGPLAGAPIAVKDNIVTDWGVTTAGSRMLEGYRSPFTATAVERLERAGAVVLGKTNCDEFAMGSSTEHCAFDVTRNPWDITRVPGGSSGGSAAAVAARIGSAALGSDTGGSVRQPASMCGVVGLKPTYGRVSRWGLIAFASSLDQIGPLALDVRDAAMLLDAISGRDARDATSADLPPTSIAHTIDEPSQAPRVGVPRAWLGRNHAGVDRVVESAIAALEGAGAAIVEVDLGSVDAAIAAYYVIANAEASSNLARYDGVRYGRRATPRPGEPIDALYARSRGEGFGEEVQRRIMLGTYVLSAGYADRYYLRALRARRVIKDEYDRAFERCDVILGPTAPAPAFAIGEKTDPLAMYLGDCYTVGANIAGLPAISVPGGFADEGGLRLPVGVQLHARAFDEDGLLRSARLLERSLDLRLPVPPGFEV